MSDNEVDLSRPAVVLSLCETYPLVFYVGNVSYRTFYVSLYCKIVYSPRQPEYRLLQLPSAIASYSYEKPKQQNDWSVFNPSPLASRLWDHFQVCNDDAPIEKEHNSTNDLGQRLRSDPGIARPRYEIFLKITLRGMISRSTMTISTSWRDDNWSKMQYPYYK